MVQKAIRRMVLRPCSAFKTISTEVVLVISVLPPIHILPKARNGTSTRTGKVRYMSNGNKSGKKIPGKQPGLRSLYRYSYKGFSIMITGSTKAWRNRLFFDSDSECTSVVGSYQRRFHQCQVSECFVWGFKDTPVHCFYD